MAIPGKLDKKSPSPAAVAIIGMACLFPGSPDLKAYWQLLMQGRDAVTDIPETHWSAADYYDADPQKADHVYCKRGAFLPTVAFDPSEFGIPPHSLEAVDTSQLLALHTARDALDNAGYGKGRIFNRERTSVVLGVTGTQEMVIPLGARLGHPLWREAILEEGIPKAVADKIVNRISDGYVSWQENSFPGLLGNVVAGRISNRLDLGGTNCVVDAACASSMSAVHLAILELQTGRSDMVITGGVDTLNDVFMHMCFSKTMTLSKTGDIRPFSMDADGTLLGEGIGMLVLKQLSRAEKDGDHIHAVIKGVGSSSDGRSNSIYAPRAAGQAKALRTAYKRARVGTDTVELVEAHGTGTRVGDKTELEALKSVYASNPKRRQKTAVGSVKSMIGHTKAAAGAAGLIKTALALENKVMPPTLKAETPDPDLNLDDSPFYINSSRRPWLRPQGHPRRAAVSSFGFGGSNFHLVLEEYNSEKTRVSWDGSVEIFSFSGRNRKAVSRQLGRIEQKLDAAPADPDAINRLAYESRLEFSTDAPCRMTFVHDMSEDQDPGLSRFRRVVHEAQTFLADVDEETVPSLNRKFYFSDKPMPGKLAFVFPGQGSQYLHMGRDLCCTFPEALNAFTLTDSLTDGHTPISASVFPSGRSGSRTDKRHQETLNQTDNAQPAIGSLSLAMLDILKRFGVFPDATCGHSYGELTALHAAGWMDRETLITLSATRGHAMARASASGPKGAMLAVKAPIEDVETVLAGIPDVVLANRNSPQQSVLSGTLSGIERAQSQLGEKGLRAVRLPVSAAFHSPLIQGAQEIFSRAVQDADLRPGSIPVFANSSGRPYEKGAVQAKKELARQMLQPVLFVDVIENMFAAGVRTFIEVGPKNVLTGLLKTTLSTKPFRALALDASCGKRFGVTDMACVLAELAAQGYPVQLDHWEDPVPKAKQRRMTVMLNGANYRSGNRRHGSRQMETPPHSTRSKKEKTSRAVLSGSAPLMKTASETAPSKKSTLQKPTIQAKLNQMNPRNKNTLPGHTDFTFVNDALQTVTQGLKSMQELQARTADAHQKFLDTQAEAGRALQHMMESTRRLAEATMGISATADPGAEASDISPVPTITISETPIPQPDSSAAPPTPSPLAGKPEKSLEAPHADPFEKTAAAPAYTPHGKETKSFDTGIIGDTLLRVVSQLTGYPEDMLNMDMDIEADLGIDSIKRVEILSSLEEELPGLPTAEPDTMGTFKTLGQIATYLGQNDSTMSPADTGDSLPGFENKPEQRTHSREHILPHTLLEVVSELTGYPVDMLDMDMDIEADLGIDSIKRVEILSTLEERVAGLPEVTPDMMGSLKTLGQIAGDLTGSSEEAPSLLNTGEQNQSFTSERPDADSPVHVPQTARRNESVDNTTPLVHQSVKVLETPRLTGSSLKLKSKGEVFILEDADGLSKAIADAFKSRGIEASLMTSSMMEEILLRNRSVPPASGLIVVAGTRTGSDGEADRFLKDVFKLLKIMAGELNETGKGSHTLLASITRLDGAFGFKGKPVDQPALGGIAGLVKTASAEWPAVFCRALDIDPEIKDQADIAKRVASEILEPIPGDGKEIGLASSGRRYTLVLENLPVAHDQPVELDLGKKDVVVVTGGARGVTTAASLELARYSGARMVLMGRSEPPTAEPAWLQGLSSPAEIKSAILVNEFNNNGASPLDIEKSYIRHMANREMLVAFGQFQDLEVDMRYFPVDIRDSEKVAAAINTVLETWGPVTAVVHGAGVIEDRLIVDKSPEQLDRVYDTKVAGWRNLLAAIPNSTLKYMVAFSSVSARSGNSGQADYAMANEALNKLAGDFALKNPACRVLAINWGPWDGGMVTPTLKKVFAKQGIGLIPLDEGARSMLVEMDAQQKHHAVEIVIGSMLPAAAATMEKDDSAADTPARPFAPGQNSSALTLSFKKEIDTQAYPILGDHVIGGKPVVPFALITEWFGHGALHENPGLVLHGIDDMRILKGVRLDAQKKLIRLFAGKPSRKDGYYEVSLELRDGVMEGRDVIHSRGKAILTDTVPEAPNVDIDRFQLGDTYSRNAQEIYNDILFHGMELRGIKEILSCSSKGMVARISSAPAPSRWIRDHLRSGWIADPLVLDCAFQMATVWCYEETGNVSLPSYCARYRQYCSPFPATGVTALLEVAEISEHKMTGNFLLVDEDNQLVAQMQGYEAVMDPSLLKAFKAQQDTGV